MQRPCSLAVRQSARRLANAGIAEQLIAISDSSAVRVSKSMRWPDENVRYVRTAKLISEGDIMLVLLFVLFLSFFISVIWDLAFRISDFVFRISFYLASATIAMASIFVSRVISL